MKSGNEKLDMHMCHRGNNVECDKYKWVSSIDQTYSRRVWIGYFSTLFSMLTTMKSEFSDVFRLYLPFKMHNVHEHMHIFAPIAL